MKSQSVSLGDDGKAPIGSKPALFSKSNSPTKGDKEEFFQYAHFILSEHPQSILWSADKCYEVCSM
jgi:hypothetical protein